MNNKTIGSLLIFGVAIIGAVKLIQKPESKEKAKFEIEKEGVNTIEAKPSVASEAIKTNEVANIVEQQPQAPNADKEVEQKPPSRFRTQNSDETLVSFEKEETLDAGWAYTQEQLIYNLITQEVYANEAVKIAEQVQVKCKTETCLITTKLESVEQLQGFYRSFIKLGQDKGYEFAPVKTSPEEAIFAIYPTKAPNISIKHSATPVEVLLEEAKNSTILIPDNFYIGEGNSNILDTFTNEIVLDPRWAQSQEKLLNKILIEQIYTNLGLQTSNSINIKCKTTICLVTTKLDSEESLSKLIREIVRFLDKNEKKYYFDPVKLLPQDTILAFTPIKNEV